MGHANSKWTRAIPTTHERDIILALDAGGSSTRGLLLRADGTVLGRGCGGPGNHILCGWDAAREAIAAAVAHACGAAQLAPSAVDCAVAGSAGVGSHDEGCEVIDALLTDLMPRARVRATGDMVAAFWGALTTNFGVVVAAGTGSVCYGRNPAGDSRQVGGWGHVMGDEGSAYDIAVRALRAGARATDGRGPHTSLTERIARALDVSDFMGVAFRVYGEPMTRDAIAQLATTVTEAAGDGDPTARALLIEAGVELGRHAVTALRALGLGEVAAPVAYAGAVFDAGDLMIAAFRDAIAAACPHATVVSPEFPPVVGAFKLALQALGAAYTPAIAARLRATLEGEP